ncbi:MAG: DUF4296 domain-containing protein [Bacteroidota bacterium]
MKNLGTSLIMVFGLILLLGISNSSCQEEERPPADMQRMQEILRELHLADAWVELRSGSVGVRNRARAEVYDTILANFGHNRTTFYEDYQYYLQRPALLDTIYERLIQELDDKIADKYKDMQDGKGRPNIPRTTSPKFQRLPDNINEEKLKLQP